MPHYNTKHELEKANNIYRNIYKGTATSFAANTHLLFGRYIILNIFIVCSNYVNVFCEQYMSPFLVHVYSIVSNF